MSLPRFLHGFPRAASGAQACLGRPLSVQFEAKITGKVVTKEAHIPVEKVKLVLVMETGWTRTAWSDADGHFEFHVLDPKAVLGAKSQTVTISFEKTTGVQAHQQLRHLFMCGDDVCGPGKGDGGAAYPPGPSSPKFPPAARLPPASYVQRACRQQAATRASHSAGIASASDSAAGCPSGYRVHTDHTDRISQIMSSWVF